MSDPKTAESSTHYARFLDRILCTVQCTSDEYDYLRTSCQAELILYIEERQAESLYQSWCDEQSCRLSMYMDPKDDMQARMEAYTPSAAWLVLLLGLYHRALAMHGVSNDQSKDQSKDQIKAALFCSSSPLHSSPFHWSYHVTCMLRYFDRAAAMGNSYGHLEQGLAAIHASVFNLLPQEMQLARSYLLKASRNDSSNAASAIALYELAWYDACHDAWHDACNGSHNGSCHDANENEVHKEHELGQLFHLQVQRLVRSAQLGYSKAKQVVQTLMEWTGSPIESSKETIELVDADKTWIIHSTHRSVMTSLFHMRDLAKPWQTYKPQTLN